MNHDWVDGDFVLNKIDDSTLSKLMERFTPLVFKGDEVWTIEIPDLRKTAFTWSPKLVKEIKFEVLHTISTNHGCGYHAFFKPSIAEVLACLSNHPEILNDDDVNSFVIDMQHIDIHRSGSGHIAKTYFGKI